jgi:phage terminase Nu1 subunit (DNA packaging protein)
VIETIKTKSGRRYDLIPTIQRYIKHLQDKVTAREKTEKDAKNDSEKLEAEMRLKTAKAEIAELELEELKGEMHRAEDVEAVMTDHILLLRSMILAMPGRLAVDVTNAKSAPEAAEIIKAECHTMLNQLAAYEYDPDEYKRRVRERKGWDERTDD